MKIFALIPLRKGSTRLKNKNFLKIHGKPLYKYVTEQSLKSKFIDKTYISTDSNEIKIKHKKLEIISRSRASSTSKASTEMVIDEFLKKYDCDIIVTIQATNPFLKSCHLDLALKKFIKDDRLDCLISVVKNHHFMWKKNNKDLIKPINYDYYNRPRTQDSDLNEYIENGAFYIFRKRGFLKNKNRLHGKIALFEMPKESIYEIDDKEDLKIITKLLKK